jgi:protoporphyrinogen IX oxidase
MRLGVVSNPVTFPLPLGTLLPALVALHVVANLVWIGSILSVSVLLGRARFMADPADVGLLARRVYARLAAPAFGVSFLAGVARFALGAGAYLHMPWMHTKLGFAFVVIMLHHVLGSRARAVAGGASQAGRGSTLLGFVLFACASAAGALGVVKMLP